MIPARKKIAKEKGAEPDDFESSVAQVISPIHKGNAAALMLSCMAE